MRCWGKLVHESYIVTASAPPYAANQTFLVSDGEDVSTPELIRRMARAPYPGVTI
jgi:hypothetical protein